MRNKIASKLLKGQDVCLLCAFRYGSESRFSRVRPLQQSRFYSVSTPFSNPANAAIARRKEEDEEEDFPELAPEAPALRKAPQSVPEKPPLPSTPESNPYLSMPDWGCRCGHINLSNKNFCTMCHEPRNDGAKLYYPRLTSTKSVFKETRPRPVANDYVKKIVPRLQDQSPRSAADYHFNRYGPGLGVRSTRPAPQREHENSSKSDMSGERGGRLDYQRATSFGRSSRESTSSQIPRNGNIGVFGSDVLEQVSKNGRGKGMVQRKVLGCEPVAPISKRDAPIPNVSRVSPGVFRPGVGGLEDLERSWKSRPSSNTRYGGRMETSPRTRNAERSGFGDSYRSVQLNSNSKYSDARSSERRHSDPRSYGQSQLQDHTNKDMNKDMSIDGIMPPASSSFDPNDRRRKGRSLGRDERRSQMYEIGDAGQESVESRNDRKREAKNRRNQDEFDGEKYEAFEDEMEPRKKKNQSVKAQEKPSRPTVQLPDFISVEQLSRALKVRLDPFIQKLEDEGFEGPRYDHILDAENSAMVADLFGYNATFGGRQTIEDMTPRPPAEDKDSLPSRPPVVTIMGHVDHGKTTILDWLRKSSVVASEHGGITQHIGAFSVTMPGSERQITFLDTPGHAAFLDMRRRGAVVTDIVVLVVAADDSVKPQTIEAIKHALEAKVHIIVAINKVDKQDADVERVKQDLARNDITVEEFGGDYQAIPLSGKTGRGMAELEEAILALADVSDFRAELDGPAEGWILESKVTQAGRVATILVRRGTLRLGDFIVAGTTWARVRTLRNDSGMLVNEALPGTPVQVDGWRGEDPTAGLEVLQAENEQHAKDVVEIRQENLETFQTSVELMAMNSSRTQDAEARAKVLEWEAEQGWTGKKRRKPADNEGWIEGKSSYGPKQIHFVIKADVAGSVEALVAAVSAVGNMEVRANVIHSGTGTLSESDIKHLAATGETAYAISFNQPVDGNSYRLAEAAGLEILDHNIIYKVTDVVKEKLAAELPPIITQKVLGEAEVGKIFEFSLKKGKQKIAGCKISNGSISRAHQIRVLRNGEVIYTGTLGSLKNVKKDVAEMRKGTECGIAFEDWEDFQEGDQIQSFEEIKEMRRIF